MEIKKINQKKHIIFLKNSNHEKPKKEFKKAIFFDRDGVIIKDVHYIKNTKNVSLLKGVRTLLNYSSSLGYLNIIVTNQSGISRNFFSWDDYEKVTKRMLEIINIPGAISAIYANGEFQEDSDYKENWRKPSPHMLIKASKDFNIDLSKSILIGDRLSDLKSGENAGIRNLVHVLTGHGFNERDKVIKYYRGHNTIFNLSLIEDLSFLIKENFFQNLI